MRRKITPEEGAQLRAKIDAMGPEKAAAFRVRLGVSLARLRMFKAMLDEAKANGGDHVAARKKVMAETKQKLINDLPGINETLRQNDAALQAEAKKFQK